MSSRVPCYGNYVSIRDFHKIANSQRINCKIRAPYEGRETEGGRAEIFVLDGQHPKYITLMVSFNDANRTIFNKIKTKGIYIIRNAKLLVTNHYTHYPYRILVGKDTVIKRCKEKYSFRYNFKPFPKIKHGPIPMKHADIAGIIVSIGENVWSEYFKGNFRKIILRDENGKIVVLIIWRTEDDDPAINSWTVGDVLLVRRALIIDDFTVRCDHHLDDIRVYRSRDELQGLNKNTRVRVRSLRKASQI